MKFLIRASNHPRWRVSCTGFAASRKTYSANWAEVKASFARKEKVSIVRVEPDEPNLLGHDVVCVLAGKPSCLCETRAAHSCPNGGTARPTLHQRFYPRRNPCSPL